MSLRTQTSVDSVIKIMALSVPGRGDTGWRKWAWSRLGGWNERHSQDRALQVWGDPQAGRKDMH